MVCIILFTDYKTQLSIQHVWHSVGDLPKLATCLLNRCHDYMYNIELQYKTFVILPFLILS